MIGIFQTALSQIFMNGSAEGGKLSAENFNLDFDCEGFCCSLHNFEIDTF